MESYQITDWCHHFIKNHVNEGDICIDATVGNGQDTKLLSELVGKLGKVYGFDIQKQALEKTESNLAKAGLLERVSLFLRGHEQMADIIDTGEHGKISCVVFNLGYLPGGDHNLATKGKTTTMAIESALGLLRKNGLVSICIYSGGDSGFKERDMVLSWLRELEPKKYLVIVSEYYNRRNNPPIPVLIYKI
jgi:SAM-dependent methyltransferase